MTDNEIIEALDKRMSSGKWIGKGFLDKQDFLLLKNALDLINRQKAEIERLEKDSKRLKKVQMQLDDAMKMYSTIKAEAIKEFAERLKECSQWLPLIAMPDPFVTVSDIDNLVKEMVGADNG